MIPSPLKLAERFGIIPMFAPIAFAGLFTGIIHELQSISDWFDDPTS